MHKSLKEIPEWYDITPDIFQREIIPAYQPAVLKGIYRDWPIVKASVESPQFSSEYLRKFDQGRLVNIFFAPPSVQGHFFYKDNMQGVNFQQLNGPFADCLSSILNHLNDEAPPTIYMSATKVDDCLPGLSQENICNLVDSSWLPRLWMGNKTIVQSHFDYSDNLACVVAGRRRFTLFPPEQIDNLYVGPIDFTLAGQPMSLVSVNNPDFEKYPRFKDALAEAMVAELEPGDAIFIPSLWWHNVQALDKFNMLINYWQNSKPGVDTPEDALIHGLLTISALPEKERQAWKYFFDHYVFQTKGHPLEHLPPESRGVLGHRTSQLYHAIRTHFYNRIKGKH